MKKIQICRTVELPNLLKLARYQRAPDLGPRVLFFSGGTALRALSQELVHYTHNSIHIITPFDSGGSSAKLRNAFNMLAVGDVRNRLMALADRSVQGNPAIFKLFNHRLSKVDEPDELRKTLNNLIDGSDALVRDVPEPMRRIVRRHLKFFYDEMGDDFDLRGASVGNLILAGGYFNQGRHVDPVIFTFSRLAEVRGIVRPAMSKDLHLAVELDDGDVIVGQHNITGKEAAPLTVPIKKLFLTESLESAAPVTYNVAPKVTDLISQADIICYPPGSFYSSVLANLLPHGVGEAVSQNHCPKVYVPNSKHDPEQIGMSLYDSVEKLLSYLQASCKETKPVEDLLNYVLIDSKHGAYPHPLETDKIESLGVPVFDLNLSTAERAPFLEETRLIHHLLSLG